MVQNVQVLLHLGNDSEFKLCYVAYYASAEDKRYYDCEGAAVVI